MRPATAPPTEAGPDATSMGVTSPGPTVPTGTYPDYFASCIGLARRLPGSRTWNCGQVLVQAAYAGTTRSGTMRKRAAGLTARQAGRAPGYQP